MREFKFRVWINHKMILGVYPWAFFNPRKPHPIIMQYIGLKDSNGKEVYEGDIIYFGGFKYKIYFDSGSFLAARISSTFIFIASANDLIYNLAERPTEVIGNIYENPEILIV